MDTPEKYKKALNKKEQFVRVKLHRGKEFSIDNNLDFVNQFRNRGNPLDSG